MQHRLRNLFYFNQTASAIPGSIQQGLLRGVQQGKRDGEALLLERQLSRRFGPLSAGVKERLRTASAAQLEAWALNFVDATELDEVFGA